VVARPRHVLLVRLGTGSRGGAAGDPEAAAKRLRALRDLPSLKTTGDVVRIAEALVSGGGLPARATVDALHVAAATAHGIDYLLTWNCKHIANATMRARIEAICRAEGFNAPVMCTPEELPSRTEP
jgi:predicted nucleic acid-binding protein